MTVEILTLPEIRDVYRNQLEYDFPADERKPLGRIEASLKKGQYICYGLKDGTGILAYAFFVVIENQYLFDYFAVGEELRGTGIGSRFLKELFSNHLKSASCILLEVDDPAAADNDKEKAVQSQDPLLSEERPEKYRRQSEYLRSGFSDSGTAGWQSAQRGGGRTDLLPDLPLHSAEAQIFPNGTHNNIMRTGE